MVVVLLANEDVDRLKGLFMTLSSCGTGGGASLVFPLLKALRMDANEVFFEKPVLVDGAAIEA